MPVRAVTPDGKTTCCDAYTSISIDDGVEYCKAACYETGQGYLGDAVFQLPTKVTLGRTAFDPVARPEYQLFVALMSGEHAVHGFANRDLRAELAGSSLRLSEDQKRQSAQVSRLLHRVTAFGHRIMGASVRLRNRDFLSFYLQAA